MKSLWNSSKAKEILNDDLALRVYTSRLLGQETSLVLHGGGNTSVKSSVKNLFGEHEDVLWVKGSGWDLGTIEKEGFAPVRMDVLLKMAALPDLADDEMVKGQRSAMTNPYAPNPSVEAILHAIIPFKFVDHTHADAVITITNSPDGLKKIKAIYGEKVLIVPYVMPGFILAREIYKMTRSIDWSKYDGMVLMHHGIFSFHDDAKESYERMIRLVNKAENYLKRHASYPIKKVKSQADLTVLATIRKSVSQKRGSAMLAALKDDSASLSFANLKNVASITHRGPLTPDHVIRTKRIPLVVDQNISQEVERFAADYQAYFKRNANGKQMMLDAAPRWGVWKGKGLISFGDNLKDVQIVSDIVDHTIGAIQWAEKLGGWRALGERDMFDMEYWSLEQAKLKKADKLPLSKGKIALVTGAASGIGKACVERLQAHGAVVGALDINPAIEKLFNKKEILGIRCDVTQRAQVKKAIEKIVRSFGGLDIIVSNAGIFPPSEEISQLKDETWEKSLKINLTSHEMLMQESLPFLKSGIDPAIIIVASKNVPAPGPGASAYSVAKAGLTQLGRVAALELAKFGIRVNMLHPNQVFDTAIWTKEVLEKRSKHYNMTVEEYKKSNLLKTEITSKDVAELVCSLAGPVFAKTTGAQIPIDGGNDRVI